MSKSTVVSRDMLQCSKIIIAVLTVFIYGFIYRQKIAAMVTFQGDET